MSSSFSIAVGQSILPDSLAPTGATPAGARQLPSHPMFLPLIDDVFVSCGCQEQGRECQCTTAAAGRVAECQAPGLACPNSAPAEALDWVLASADRIVARLPDAPGPSSQVTEPLAELLWLSLAGNRDNPAAQRQAIRTALDIAANQSPRDLRRDEISLHESNEVKRLKSELVQVTAQRNALLESNARYQSFVEQVNEQFTLRNNLQSLRSAIAQLEHPDLPAASQPLRPQSIPGANDAPMRRPVIADQAVSHSVPRPLEPLTATPSSAADHIARNPGAYGLRPHYESMTEKTLTSDKTLQPARRLPLLPIVETPRPEQDGVMLEPVFAPEQIQQLMQKLQQQQRGLEQQLQRQQQQIQSNQALLDAMEAIANTPNR